MEALRAAAQATTRHGRLTDMQVTLEGNHVYLAFEFTTGDASGQNMVTIAAGQVAADLTAKYDARNAAAIKRLVAAGAQLRPFSTDIRVLRQAIWMRSSRPIDAHEPRLAP